MPKKKKNNTMSLHALKKKEIEEFVKEAKKLKKLVKAHISKGQDLMDDAIEENDLRTFAIIANSLYFEGPKSEVSMGHLQNSLKGYKG